MFGFNVRRGYFDQVVISCLQHMRFLTYTTHTFKFSVKVFDELNHQNVYTFNQDD